MALNIERLSSTAFAVSIEGMLDREDYKQFVPPVEECIKANGKVNLLVKISDFRGWSPAALWEDLKFDVRHYGDVSRIALVGKNASQEWMATISKPFTKAEVKFYVEEDADSARQWVTGA